MNNTEQNITIAEIKKAFNSIFPQAVKKIEVEEEEEKNTFVFEMEFKDGVEELIIPDGIFIGFIDFKEKYIEGFVDGVSFLEFVKENS